MINLTEAAKQELKDSVNMASIIQEEGYELSPNGPKWRGVCPFEAGSTNKSKFVASDDFYKCWACPAKGDVFTWFQEKHGMSWMEAIEHVAELGNFDLTPYKGPVRPETKAERLRRLAGTALVAIAELSFETARALPAEERKIDGIDVAALVEGRELGLLPDPETVRARLDELGVDKEVRREAGIEEAGGQFTRRWVFWSWRKKQITAGRLYGRPGPVVGAAGSRSRGWTTPEHISSESRANGMILAWDDRMYIDLRSRGVEHVARAVSRTSLSDVKALRLEDLEKPPLLLIRDDRAVRTEAWDWALELLAVNPRLRVGDYREVDGEGLERVAQLEEGIGTIIDWQIGLAAQSGVLEDAAKKELLRQRLLSALEKVKAGSVEHVVYEHTISGLAAESVALR